MRGPLKRPYYYATGIGTTVHAYTKDEWVIGGSQPSGNYAAHTTAGLWIVTTLMTIPAFFAPLFLIIAVTSLNLIMVVFGLLATALFTGGWLVGIRNVHLELRASKQRKLKGLPKPRFALSDDQARRWFEENPAGIPVTRENFPDSTRAFPAGAVRGL
jgi:hypothetical protein